MSAGKKIVFAFLAAMVPMLLFALAEGPDPGYSGAPPDGNPNACASSGCHTGLPNGGPINSSVFGGNVTAMFSPGGTYTPGGPAVTITVSVSDPVNTWHGFQMTARLDSDLTKQAGRFSYASNTGVFVLCSNNVPRTPSGNCPASGPVEFIEHYQPATTTWTFTWTPPATNQGSVHFYIAGNAVNHDGINDVGDHVYTANYVLAVAGPSPTITEVRQAEGWGDTTNISSGTWFQIKGTNLSSTMRTWATSDFTNGGNNAPTSLDGVSVTVNSKPAFIYFVSSGQINAQAPDDPGSTGPVSVVVTNSNGSATSQVTKVSVSPGLLAPPSTFPFSFFQNGKQYLDATVGLQNLYVGSASLVSNFPYPFTPAKPGDTIWLYGIGFGDANPALPAGTVASSDKLTASVTITFDQTPATVTYAGHYPGYVGLYLFMVTVPQIANGDHQIVVSLNGQQVPQTVYLTVHN